MKRMESNLVMGDGDTANRMKISQTNAVLETKEMVFIATLLVKTENGETEWLIDLHN